MVKIFMDEKVADAMHQAYAGEAKAFLRLRMYAQKAEEEGYPHIARLFRVIAASEEVHGRRALRLLRDAGTTEENLTRSFESETKMAGVAYDAFIRLADNAGDAAAVLHFSQSRDVEETHAKLYKRALDNMLEERTAAYALCEVCGYIVEDTIPETCPVCGAPKAEFIVLDV